MAKSTELTAQESRELLASPVYQTIKNFEVQQRMAQMYVASTIVPAQFKGNIGNCVIAIDMAQRMGANPLMVMQNLYIVNGNPAWSAKFLISCINTCGRFTPLRYEYKGEPGTDGYGCRAYAYERSDREHKEPLYGVWVTWEMVKKEGWHIKRDRQGNDTKTSKWLSIPDIMFIYRAAAFWARAYAPEISMGFLTKEEADEGVNLREVDYEDVTAAPAAVTPEAETPAPAETEAAPSSAEAPIAPPVAEAEAPAPTQVAAEAKAAPAQKPADVIRDAMARQKVDTTTGEVTGLFD